jgi:hypothetical protein
VTKLRLKIKSALYKQALCERKGIVHFDHKVLPYPQAVQ